jgi:hypothetical protein
MSTTFPGPNTSVTEGSGPCGTLISGPNGCDSLNVTYTITNTSANSLTFSTAGGAAFFVSGDPLDQFINSTGGDGTCGGFSGTIASGAACTLNVHYITTITPDFNGDSGLNGFANQIFDENNPDVHIQLWAQATIVDPTATPLPAALPLFATGLGGLGLLGWRRKRKNAAAAM